MTGKNMNSKWTLSIFLGLLALLIIAQNAGVMQLRFLFWHLSASRIIFLTLVFSLGLILGFLWGRRPRGRS